MLSNKQCLININFGFEVSGVNKGGGGWGYYKICIRLSVAILAQAVTPRQMHSLRANQFRSGLPLAKHTSRWE